MQNLVKWPNQYITLSNTVIIIKSITMCYYFTEVNSHQIQDFKEKETITGISSERF